MWPVDGGTITQVYHSYNGGHYAIDIGASEGTPVYAAKGGTVYCASNVIQGCSTCKLSAGYHVVIKQTDGIYAIYAHLSEVSVKKGDTVSVGKQIGKVGNTGNSNGAHLHFELRTRWEDSKSVKVNPLDYLTAFKNVYAYDITETSAVLKGDFGTKSFPFSSGGFYIGTSSNNMQKITDKKASGYEYFYNGINALYFNTSEYYGALKKGTTYYYQIWIVLNGVEYKSDICSFTTKWVACTHTWDNGEEIIPICCDKIGMWRYTCTLCGEKRYETFDAIDCIPGNWIVTKQAACTETGMREQRCTMCDSVLKTESITAKGHNWNSGVVTKAPACVATGTRTYTCTSCNGTKTETIAATGNHTAGSWTVTKEATCTVTGTKVQKCTACSTVMKTETIAVKGHTWNSGAVTKSPTCTSTGTRTYTCTLCNEIKTETIVATGVHTFGYWKSHGTSTHNRVCSGCGKTESLSHRWDTGKVTVKPGEITEGKTLFTCFDCGETKTQIIPASHVHSYGSAWVSNESGHWHVCSCSEQSSYQSHIPGVAATEATPQTCETCGYVIKQALGHTHAFSQNYVKDETDHWQECSCGENSAKESHKWDAGQITKAPTTESTGEKQFTCVVCYSYKVEEVPIVEEMPPTEDAEPEFTDESQIEQTEDAYVDNENKPHTDEDANSQDSGSLNIDKILDLKWLIVAVGGAAVLIPIIILVSSFLSKSKNNS